MGYWAAVAALVGAGGTVGGGLLADDGGTADRTVGGGNIASNPLVGAGTLQSLGMFGAPITDQTSLFTSPTQQAISARFSLLPTSNKGKKKIARSVNMALQIVSQARADGDNRSPTEIINARHAQVLAAEDSLKLLRKTDKVAWRAEKERMKRDPLHQGIKSLGFISPTGGTKTKFGKHLEQVVQSSGFSSLDDLLNADLDFRSNVGGVTGERNEIAEQSRLMSQLSRDAVQASLGGLNVDNLRQLEEDRIFRDLQRRQSDLLAAGNVGGFNPGGGLEELLRQEQDAPLTALARANALAQGRISVGQGALSLDPALIASGIAPAFVTQPNNATLIPGQAPNNALASSLSSAGLIGGASILNAPAFDDTRSA